MNKTILSAVLSLCLLSTTSYAAEVNSAIISDFENSILKVTGTVTDGETGVTVIVVKKELDETEKNEISGGMLDGNIASFQNASVDGKNFFSEFEFVATGEGLYNVYVSNNNKPFEFYYVSKESVVEFVEKLGNKEIPKEKMYEELEKYSNGIGIDISFAKDKSAARDYLVNIIYSGSDEIKNEGITAVRRLTLKAQNELEFMEKLKDTETVGSVNELINEYHESAYINVTDFNKLSDSSKQKVLMQFIRKKYSDMDSFRADFKAAVSSESGSQGNGNNSSGKGSGSGGGSMRDPVTKNDHLTIPSTSEPDKIEDNILLTFPDIIDVEWAWESISYLTQHNILNGVSDGEFKPKANITREQFAKIITLAFDKYDSSLSANYNDAAENAWYSPYVASAAACGYMNGIGDGNFGIASPITREDICVAIYRAAKDNGINFTKTKTDFTDFENVSDYAKEAVSMLAGEGIINGMGDGNFAPKQKATRAQAAKLVYAVIGGNK